MLRAIVLLSASEMPCYRHSAISQERSHRHARHMSYCHLVHQLSPTYFQGERCYQNVASENSIEQSIHTSMKQKQEARSTPIHEPFSQGYHDMPVAEKEPPS
jgi:hypothetical protein